LVRLVHEKLSMSLTIRYRNPQRPDEAGMIVVADQVKAEETKNRLEGQGFEVIEVATAPFFKAPKQPH
jgi:hypothetical protein